MLLWPPALGYFPPFQATSWYQSPFYHSPFETAHQRRITSDSAYFGNTFNNKLEQT